ncbi:MULTISPECIES: hypothetical protein [Chryseobacterium]|uniref:hypothetical protein n=1 Tax=Chryseobacterium TaxID=59732 RepID=UPI001957FB39|nr:MULTISPECIES: hypothetical protein [Chryseobacterium]MBM7421433.1 hypothetical protein [Chryseobacterium sp. JUb44]MDH6211396.1 hypothetical protein [Chryseobacterium sp. BIGb0186]WSO10049.1 hypothetical protein VUJ64_19725 [Chryseobacterium scophthalmum]
MKKNHLKIIIAAFIIGSSFTIHSCGKDEDITSAIPVIGIAQDPNNFKGDITNGQVVTLDPMKLYKLTGIVTVKNGGTLVIPAGTRITATAGASSYVLVEQSGRIYANGTPGSPILFTSSTAEAGNWGGIVICGKAPINTGNTSSSEIGNLTYGGTDTTDNSGALNYVRIEYAGAEFAANKKFNGLSLFGIGNETRVESVALLNNADDGIEIYGGTVNVSYIVSIGNTNNAFSYKDGWIGNATNIYTKRKADGTGNTGITGINNAGNDNASPRSNPTIKNVTFIGGTSGESNGIKLKQGTFATLDNVVISDWSTGINIESDSTVARFNGKKRITNVLFKNTTTEVSLKSSVGATVPIVDTTYTKKPDATGAGNGILTPAWAVGWSGLQ